MTPIWLEEQDEQERYQQPDLAKKLIVTGLGLALTGGLLYLGLTQKKCSTDTELVPQKDPRHG